MANDKRKLHRIVALGIGIVLFASCASKSNYQNSEIIDWNDFKTIEHLTGNVVAFDSMLMKPWLLQVYDTLLVTCNL